jgi:hypothetical protein
LLFVAILVGPTPNLNLHLKYKHTQYKLTISLQSMLLLLALIRTFPLILTFEESLPVYGIKK